MKFEHVPLAVGTQSLDPSSLVFGLGLAVAVALIALNAPRLLAFGAAAGVVTGALLIN